MNDKAYWYTFKWSMISTLHSVKKIELFLTVSARGCRSVSCLTCTNRHATVKKVNL